MGTVISENHFAPDTEKKAEPPPAPPSGGAEGEYKQGATPTAMDVYRADGLPEEPTPEEVEQPEAAQVQQEPQQAAPAQQAEQPQQTEQPQQQQSPDPVLHTLSLYRIFVSPHGHVFTKNSDGTYREMNWEETSMAIENLAGKMKWPPEYVSYGLQKIQEMESGVPMNQYFNMVPMAYRAFVKYVQDNINNKPAMDAFIKQYGADAAPEIQKMISSIGEAIQNKQPPLDYVAKKHNIAMPQPSQAPSLQEPVDPVKQAIQGEKLKQEQATTVSKQKEASMKEEMTKQELEFKKQALAQKAQLDQQTPPKKPRRKLHPFKRRQWISRK